MNAKRSAHYSFVRVHGVPDGWTEVRLRDVAKFVGGGTPDSSEPEFWNGDIPWLSPTEMTGLKSRFARTSERRLTQKGLDACNCCLLQPGSIVMTTRGTVGLVVIAGVPLTCNQSCEALIPREEIQSEFLYYLLVYIRPLIERFGAGTTFSSVTRRDIRDIHFALPSKIEREEIVKRLVASDEAIAAAEERLTAARRVKTALMQQLFTRGLPGRHTQFQQTKIGEIPVGWEVVPLGRCAGIVSGIALNSDRAPRFHSRQYLTVIHVQRERLDLSEVRHLEVWPEELPNAAIQEGDLLVVEGHANPFEIGRAAMATGDVAGFAFQNHLFRVRVLPESKLTQTLLLGVLNSERVRRHWGATCNTSSGLNTINRRMLRRLLIPRPSLEEQEEIASLLASANDTIAACESELHALDRLRRSLLQNLLTGRVRVNL